MASRLRFLAATAALTLAPSVASATGLRSWTACTSGSVYTCNSISIATTAIMSGTTRIGTAVVVNLHNLQGQLGGGNELWSALNTVRFYVQNRFATPSTFGTTTTLGGGATGTGSWGAVTLSQFVGNGTWGVLRLQRSTATSGVGGCTGGSGPVAPTLFTCSSGSAVALSFTMAENFDAWETTMFMQSNVTNGVTATQGCYSSDAPSATFNECANITETTVTPEPLSIALLGTGLLGLGGAHLRRRNKKNEV